MTDNPEPWWATDPDLMELRRQTIEDFEIDLEPCAAPGPNVPDPVVSEILGGACWRELASAREGLAQARDRYDAAVRNARVAGLSWGELGRVLGVSKQQLHLRFSRHRQDKPEPEATLP
jgi:hypothetical protein